MTETSVPLKIFIIDVDGTICEHIRNEDGIEKMRDAEPYKDSIRAINKLYEEGHYICYFTARTDAHEDVTKEWFDTHGVKYHQLILNKPRKLPPYAEYHFIDDAHIKATTFKGKFTSFVRKKVEIEVFRGIGGKKPGQKGNNHQTATRWKKIALGQKLGDRVCPGLFGEALAGANDTPYPLDNSQIDKNPIE